MNDLPTLTTDRLILNRVSDEDIPRLVELCGDWKIAETTLHIPHPYTEQDARDWIGRHDAMLAEGVGYPFAIRPAETGELIGVTGIHPTALHRRAEIGYWIGVPYWGKGYCTEAAREVIRFGFEDLNLNAITCGYFVGNTASEHVMRKLGIPFEGIRRQHFFRHGRFVDLAVGTLLRGDWSARVNA